MATNYTTKTASLKATTADIRKVNAKKITAEDLQLVNSDGSVTSLQSGINVGDGNSDETKVISAVTNVSFAGKYVNVVTNDDGSVTLYINEDKSLKSVSSLSGAPGSSSYYQFTNADYTVTGAAAKGVHGTKTVGNTSGYSQVTLTAKTTAGNPTVSTGAASDTIFNTNSKDNKIWFRTTVNGVVGDSASQELSADLTNKTLTKDGVTLKTSNKVLTKDHASLGKVPGQTETSFTLSFDPDTVVPNGGSIRVEWAISKSEPATWNATDLFYAVHTATPTVSAITASLTDEKLSSKVSGMQYVTAGSTLNVQVASLTNSQKNITKSLNRLRVFDNTTYDSTNKTDYTIHTFKVAADGTMTNGLTETSGDGAKASTAVFSLNKNITTGGRIAAASFDVTGSAWDYDDADGSPSVALTKATINRPYYGTLTDSTDTVERFSKENKRTDADRVEWGTKSETLFTGTENVIGGRVPAVVQMGKLYHPASSSIIADANGNKPASSDSEAVFYRVIKMSTGTGGTPKLKLTGSNLNDSKVGIYLTGIKSDGSLEPKTWIVNKEPSVSDSIGTGIAAAGGVSASQVLFDFNTTLGIRPRECDGFLLMIVLKKGAPALGPMTFAKQ